MKLKLTAPAPRRAYIRLALAVILYLAFLFWVKSWMGLVVLPFIYDAYITKNINWGWWKESDNPLTRLVMGWVDALVFALVAIYFLNQFFFQNFVIPSSSLEKTLLTGDYLLVSKLSYGPRIPQTPLSMPLTQHTLPVFDCKSYLEYPHWPYRRVEGLGHVKLNDIVVFNYPAGDTVALNMQNQDYYRLVYQYGDEALRVPATDSLPSSALTPGTPYEEQQAVFRRIYAAGQEIMRANPAEFGRVTGRPVDRRENYVKRCVGLPGQTLLIRNDTIYLDGKPNREPDHSQYCYDVVFRAPLPEALKRELGITDEDLSQTLTDNAGRTHVFMPLTRHTLAVLKKQDFVESISRASFLEETPWLYPQNMAKDWTTSNYGGPNGIWIPKKGGTLRLTTDILPIYERPIRVYEGNRLEVKNGKIFINGRQTDRYTFKMDYYWMQGDNRDNSADSRFWGFVPEDHVVGKPIFVWLSLDPDYGLFDGKIRWNRIFKWVADAK